MCGHVNNLIPVQEEGATAIERLSRLKKKGGHTLGGAEGRQLLECVGISHDVFSH